MDTLALEATLPKKAQNGAVAPAPAKRKPAKKTKKAVVFFEVEILDAKTKDKLCFLDKVGNMFTFTFTACITQLYIILNSAFSNTNMQLHLN